MNGFSWFRRPRPVVRLAPLRTEHAGSLAAIHASAFARPWSTLEFERLLADRIVFADGLFFGGRAEPSGFVLSRLAAGEASIGELAAPYDMSLQAVSKHVTVLERAGLVAKTRSGQRRTVRLDAQVLDLMSGWIARYQRQVEERYRRLDDVLAGLDADVIGLNEIENTPGVQPLADIVAGLNDLPGDDTYAYIDTGVLGTDAIRVGLIYRSDVVTSCCAGRSARIRGGVKPYSPVTSAKICWARGHSASGMLPCVPQMPSVQPSASSSAMPSSIEAIG